MKTYTLEQMTDKHIGKKGTARRDTFEEELRLDVLGHKIKQIRQERRMTQTDLGVLVGVQKAQISKIENNMTNARLDTILKVFNALGARVRLSVEM
ncbi:MAG: helix-turn-helix domain-containing protein [Dysgonamonadaceae bacterium]|jgi:DNA-binding XRE family transcriptional regulator|nr:helix-turn-helix domain-containing protein [Dysgonamonadaceae bacterium]